MRVFQSPELAERSGPKTWKRCQNAKKGGAERATHLQKRDARDVSNQSVLENRADGRDGRDPGWEVGPCVGERAGGEDVHS